MVEQVRMLREDHPTRDLTPEEVNVNHRLQMLMCEHLTA